MAHIGLHHTYTRFKQSREIDEKSRRYVPRDAQISSIPVHACRLDHIVVFPFESRFQRYVGWVYSLGLLVSYVTAPSLTKERFLPNNFATHTAAITISILPTAHMHPHVVAWECAECAHTNKGTEPSPCSGCGAVEPIRYMIFKRRAGETAPTAISVPVHRPRQCALSAAAFT